MMVTVTVTAFVMMTLTVTRMESVTVAGIVTVTVTVTETLTVRERASKLKCRELCTYVCLRKYELFKCLCVPRQADQARSNNLVNGQRTWTEK